jgi:hypothetical protein
VRKPEVSAPAATSAAAVGRTGGTAHVLRVTVPAVALATLVAVSAVLRTRSIDAGLWIDEGLALGIAGQPPAEIPGLLRQDGSPPLHYVLLHAWTALAGDGDASARVPSLLAALACVPAGLWAGRRLFGARAGWICALLMATCPILTAMAQEARMYSLTALLGLVACACWAQAFAFRRRAYAAGFALALALLLYTHNWGVHLAAGTVAGLVPLVHRAPDRRLLLRDAALAYGAAGLAWAAWLPTLLFQAENTGAPWSDTPGPLHLLDSVWVPLGEGAGAAIVLAAAAAGLMATARHPGSAAGAAAAGFAVSVVAGGALAWAGAQLEPGWADRYLAVFAGPVLLLAAAGLAALPLRAGLTALAAVSVLWAADPAREQKSNVREVAAAASPALRPGDTVIVAHPEQIAVLSRYMPGGLRWATTLGPAADPRTFDWRRAVERLRAAEPGRTSASVLERVAPGERVVLALPVVQGEDRWRAPWTALVRGRAEQWRRLVADRPDLRRVSAVPRTRGALPPTSLELVVYERVRSYSRPPR